MQAMLARKDFEIETSRAERERQQEQRCLAQAVEAIRNLGSCFESLRADVALLTTDNECLTAELQKQHDEMFLVYELKFSLDVANSISEQLAAVGEQASEACLLQQKMLVRTPCVGCNEHKAFYTANRWVWLSQCKPIKSAAWTPLEMA